MSALPPPVAPRRYSGVRVMLIPGEQLPPGGLPIYTHFDKENGAIGESNYTSILNAERELEFMNHCFDDVERFMARLQQTAEAQSVLNQRSKKRSRKSKKDQDDDLLTLKACPPSEEEFVDLFQKIKYSLSLLDRLQSSIAQPDAPELLHHIFAPLRLMVKTTGGPALGASVVSPAMTSGAVSLLQDHLIEEEKELWTSLGPNWTSPCLNLNVSVPPYSPVFLDGWKPQAYNSTGQLFEDPIESQHKQDAFRESREARLPQNQVRQTAEHPGEGDAEIEGNGLPPEGDRLYCCSYDFVARNSSELSVLQGETLEVIDSSKRWWKCQNRFDQIGFVPSNILEPLSALNNTGRSSPVVRRESKKMPMSPPTKYFSYAPSSSVSTSPIATSPMRPQSMVLPSIQGEDNDRVLIVNDELLQRLAGKSNSVRPPVVPRTADTTPLNYHSPSAEVEAWLTTKGFSQQTVQRLGILNGAQLFSLKKEELRTASPEEGARVYSQIMVQKALLEDVRKATELETAMEKQKLKIGLKSEND
ncbi:epidermal growth factor receptor kinase substrate 8-like protein 1a [Cebidichthys violaceus]|uniref:epidermal growth factor receptor kinase substrate 8-like protein 1a n=1 Tax=Cebidichthys violaceus TaxID=271503 RepID=UPI0035C99933